MKRILLVLIAVLIALGVNPAAAADYPSQTITFVVPYGPGGTDREARLLAPFISEVLGQSIVVENKTGGGGAIGTNFVARSKPDGYTLEYGAVTVLSLAPNLKNLPYRMDDMQPLASTSWLPNMLATRTDAPWQTVQELIDYAKKNPRKVKFGSAGTGTAVHLAQEAFADAAGIEITHVPFKGTGEAITNTVGGHVDCVFSMPQAVVPQVKGGNLRALAVFAKERFPGMPDIPTLNEAGIPVDPNAGTNRLGLFAPAATPKEICDAVSNAVKTVLEDEKVLAKLKEINSLPEYLNQEEFTKLAQGQSVMYQELIKKIGLKD
jgi:tripartite-type tricarboxylate transporter receptor subunit TctC